MSYFEDDQLKMMMKASNAILGNSFIDSIKASELNASSLVDDQLMMMATNANLGNSFIDSIKASELNASSSLVDDQLKMMKATNANVGNSFIDSIKASELMVIKDANVSNSHVVDKLIDSFLKNDYGNNLLNRYYLASSSTDQIIKESKRLKFYQEQFFRDHYFSDSVLESVRKQASVFADLSNQSATRAVEANTFQLSKASLAWDIASSSLIDRVHSLGFIDNNSSLLSNLLEVPRVYTNFVSHTADLLANSQSNDISSRLRGSLFLAEHQLLEITHVYNSFISLPERDDEELSYFSNIDALKSPFRQQEEILNGEFFENENDIIALTKSSTTAQTVELAIRVLSLITQCNEAAKTSELRGDIFKPTNRLMTVFTDLPLLVVTDKYRFGDLIDHLYFIFYEASGKDKLRFLVTNGGVLIEEECDLIWCIKHLRNKLTRHDVDHGDKNSIKKSWGTLSETFQWLGLTSFPTDADFQKLHYKLLELASDFLSEILQKLELK